MSIELQKPDYIVIYVSNMQRSTAFYRDVLGLPLKFTSPGWTEFNTGPISLALHMAGGQQGQSNQSQSAAGQPSRQSHPSVIPAAGLAQLAFVVDDIQAVYEALKAKDVQFTLPPQEQRPGALLAVFSDPDGFGITLQQRQAQKEGR